MAALIFRKTAYRACLFAAVTFAMALFNPAAKAAIVWDGEAGTSWWFNPINWNVASNSNTVVPPSGNAAGTSSTDTLISNGLPVVYDPANDPFFSAAASLPYPSGFGPQTINQLYMSRNTTVPNQLTIRGDLTFLERINIGRSSGTRGVGVDAIVIQESGTVTQNVRELDLGQVDTGNVGYGNGTWDYRGGILNLSGPNGLRLSNGSNSDSSDLLKAGPGGIGKFVVHNPATSGFIRVRRIVSSAFAGFQEGLNTNGSDSVFDPMFDPDGDDTGVAIWEFHYNNGGTRPIQISEGFSLNNGVSQATRGIRSSRLDFVVGSAACAGAGCVPNNVGLFDIDFDGNGFVLAGEGDLNNNGVYNDDRVFSNVTNTAAYREGDMVSANFGGVQYNWTISYSGKINWADPNISQVASITGTGTGEDIVLIGHSSVSAGTPGDFDNDGDVDGRDFLAWQRGNSPSPLSATDLTAWQTNYGNGPLAAFSAVPEPTSLVLLGALVLPLLGRRRG